MLEKMIKCPSGIEKYVLYDGYYHHNKCQLFHSHHGELTHCTCSRIKLVITENECNDPCRDPNCRDAGDHGIGLHCHHDHRDPETKRVHDEFEERERHRDEAIYWLGDNLDKIQNVVNTKETPILNRNNPMNTRERIERIERLLTLVGKVDKTILDESVPVDTTARITISLLMLCLSQELETIRKELTC